RSRAAEFYGFAALTSTYLLFAVYVLWALLPDECVHWLGITWYPNREWALLIPAWSITAVIFTYIAYWAIAIAGTPSPNEMSAITDSRASLPALNKEDFHNPYVESAQPGAIPQLYDIPIGMVNRVLY
ncbi:PIG-P, partial [Cyathus striatus]